MKMLPTFRCGIAACLLLALCAPVAANAFKDLQGRAAQGDAQAEFELAQAYDLGDGTRRDRAQAAHWYRLAAEQGHAAAQNALGSLYQAGEGVPRDEVTAFGWYEKSAAQGYGEGCTNLGFLYDLGKGVAQDRVKANALYLQGAESGSLNAMLDLAINLWDGQGALVDKVEAYKWLDVARFLSQRSPERVLKWRVRGALDELQKELNADQVREGQRRASDWLAAHRPG